MEEYHRGLGETEDADLGAHNHPETSQGGYPDHVEVEAAQYSGQRREAVCLPLW